MSDEKFELIPDLLPKQRQAIEYLLHPAHKDVIEVLYSGGVGAGKSWIGAYFCLSLAFQYAGVRILLGRKQLKDIKRTQLNSIKDVLRHHDIYDTVKISEGNNDQRIQFPNGSEIIMVPLAFQPNDPDNDWLAGYEITAAWVDEVSQIDRSVYTTLLSRLRYKVDEYGIGQKCLTTTNPLKSHWTYKHFYLPYRDGTQHFSRRMIQTSVADNPKSGYKPHQLTLEYYNGDMAKYQRLVKGSWEYSDDDTLLFKREPLEMCFEDFHQQHKSGAWRITCDMASKKGADSTAIGLWKGMTLVRIETGSDIGHVEAKQVIRNWMQSYGISPKRVILDANGVGGGTFEDLKCIDFVGHRKPLRGEDYKNLKSQMFWKLSRAVEEGTIKFQLGQEGRYLREQIIDELMAHKGVDFDGDGKASVTPKEEIRRLTGSSPDLADMISMAMFFEQKGRGMNVMAK